MMYHRQFMFMPQSIFYLPTQKAMAQYPGGGFEHMHEKHKTRIYYEQISIQSFTSACNIYPVVR